MSSRGAAHSVAGGSVFVPTALNDALQVLRQSEGIDIWSGGTWWMHRGSFGPSIAEPGSGPILALHAVRELRRVVRSDAHVDVGAAVPVGRLLEVGRRMLSPPIFEALQRVGPRPVRGLATLGGAISLPDSILPVRSMLQLHDARVELRRHGGSRWIAVAQARDTTPGLGRSPTELVSRIRIPAVSWTHWMMRSFGRIYPPSPDSLVVIAAAQVDKANLAEIRIALTVGGRYHVRPVEAESELAGRALPLNERDQRVMTGALESNVLYGEAFDDLMRRRALYAVREFLQRLKRV